VPGYLSSAWQEGEFGKRTRQVTIPEADFAGEYKVKIGVWDPVSKRHLPLRKGWWFRSYGPKTLTTLTIGSPQP